MQRLVTDHIKNAPYRCSGASFCSLPLRHGRVRCGLLSPELRARLRASNVHIQRGDVSQKMDDAAARQRTADLVADVQLLGESLLTLVIRLDALDRRCDRCESA